MRNSSSSRAPERLLSADLILMLLAAPTGTKSVRQRLDGITRLEKLLFLADQETSVPSEVTDPFEFEPYDFGPYSKAIYEAVELLEQAGLVQEDRAFQGQALDSAEEAQVIPPEEREGVERRFWLTEDGAAVAKLLSEQHPKVASQLGQIKAQYGDMTLRRLIRYVYAKYPKYAEASKIRDEIL
jgi:uncharacterized protein YwgA